MSWPGRTPAARVEALLDRLECHLQSGDVAGVTALTPKLEQAMGRLARSDRIAPAQAGALQSRARHLSRLVEAALRGVADVRAALVRPAGFSSYDAAGQSGRVGAAVTHVERRR